MSKSYHAEIINLSQRDTNIFKQLKVIGIRTRFLGIVKIYKLSIPENNLLQILKLVQDNMSRTLNKEWYATFHNADNAIVVFRKKVFHLSTIGITPEYQKPLNIDNAEDKQYWDEMLNYSKSLGIPDSQLDFLPTDFKTEAY
jgi:tryptophanyl-tRNA synthetase